MIGRFMDGSDKLKMILGMIGSFMFGAALPAFCLLFGGMIDGVGGTGSDSATDTSGYDALQKQAIWMLCIGFGVFIFSWF
jgi:hypothetical protein